MYKQPGFLGQALNIALAQQFDAKGGAKSTEMTATRFNTTHQVVCAQASSKWCCSGVCTRSHRIPERLCDATEPTNLAKAYPVGIVAIQNGSLHPIHLAPAFRRNNLVNWSFLNCNEFAPTRHRLLEELAVGTPGCKALIKLKPAMLEHLPFHKNVASASFLPAQQCSSAMDRPLTESAFDKPRRRCPIKEGVDWAQGSINVKGLNSAIKVEQPKWRREFIVIYDADVIAACKAQSVVPCHRDDILGANRIQHVEPHFGSYPQNGPTRGSSRVVVHDNNRKGEQGHRLLHRQLAKQTLEHSVSPERRDTNGNMVVDLRQCQGTETSTSKSKTRYHKNLPPATPFHQWGLSRNLTLYC
ncbi:MAG: hypothetical protein QHJ82_16865 [Verrucomicrobiota bacterium]|nr:hypothetical protein [Verrucomicrobiota bacterium]